MRITKEDLRAAIQSYAEVFANTSGLHIAAFDAVAQRAEAHDALVRERNQAQAEIEALTAKLADAAPQQASDPVYQTCFVRDQWRDVDRAEYDRAKALRSDLARIVYTAPSTSTAPALTQVPQAVLDALRFYARGDHYTIDDDHQTFDTVSGEPPNWLMSERDDDCTMIEDGSIAKAALCGDLQGFEEPAEPLEDEVLSAQPLLSAAHDAAVRTLEGKGYTYHGGEQWRPPRGETPKWIVHDTAAMLDVIDERRRQVTVEGWTLEHDDQHNGDELREAAICYIQGYPIWRLNDHEQRWPWAEAWWKPTTQRRDTVKAVALLLADIERMDRATAQGAAS